MTKLSLSLALILMSFQATAVLGPRFAEHERPHSVCAIEFFTPHNLKVVDEICSVVVVDSNWGLTAGHCVTKLPDRPHRVLCRDQITTTIDHVISNPLLKLEQLRFVELAHQNDSALVRFSRPVSTPALTFVKTLNERQDLIARASVCGIFGHGGFREELRRAGYSTQAKILPSQLEIEENLIRIKGIGGINSGLVEPGDSGGSLACKNEFDQWVHLAQVSGRKHNYVSFFAPTDVLAPFIQSEFSPSAQAIDQEQAQRWQTEDLKRDLKACERNYKRVMGEDFMPTVPLSHALNECETLMLEEALMRFDQGEQIVAKLKPYTLVTLKQEASAIRSKNPFHNKRYLEGSNPFSITDHHYTQLTLTHIDRQNGIAQGVFRSFGGPEFFACLENVICDSAEFDEVQVKLQDLFFDRR